MHHSFLHQLFSLSSVPAVKNETVRSSCSERTGSQAKGVEKVTQGSHCSSAFQPITASCKIMPQGQAPSPAESPGKSFQPITMSCKIVSGEAPQEESLCATQCQIHIFPLKAEPFEFSGFNEIISTGLFLKLTLNRVLFVAQNSFAHQYQKCLFFSFPQYSNQQSKILFALKFVTVKCCSFSSCVQFACFTGYDV